MQKENIYYPSKHSFIKEGQREHMTVKEEISEYLATRFGEWAKAYVENMFKDIDKTKLSYKKCLEIAETIKNHCSKISGEGFAQSIYKDILNIVERECKSK